MWLCGRRLKRTDIEKVPVFPIPNDLIPIENSIPHQLYPTRTAFKKYKDKSMNYCFYRFKGNRQSQSEIIKTKDTQDHAIGLIYVYIALTKNN